MNPLAPLIDSAVNQSTAKKMRICAQCGDLFEPEYIEAICDLCAMVAPKARAKDIEPWHESWPKRAIADLTRINADPLKRINDIWNAGLLTTHPGTIALIGDRGRGKTVMATSLANHMRKDGSAHGLYIRALDLFVAIRRSYSQSSEEDEFTVLKRFRKAGLLVIDEFQEKADTPFEDRMMANIIDHRHANLLPTIIIANLSAEKFQAHVGPSIIDRIAQTGAIVECNWENLRK